MSQVTITPSFYYLPHFPMFFDDEGGSCGSCGTGGDDGAAPAGDDAGTAPASGDAGTPPAEGAPDPA